MQRNERVWVEVWPIDMGRLLTSGLSSFRGEHCNDEFRGEEEGKGLEAEPG